MLFSSIPFLFFFLPCVLLVYFLVPGKLRSAVLLAASLFFYAWGEPRYVIFMVISILQGYAFGLLIEKFHERKPLARLFLALSCIWSIGMLAVCKYADFFIENLNAATGLSVPLLHIALPIGISFYTFQVLSYVIDIFHGGKAQKNLIHLAAYIAMFPQLIAGPIVRYEDVASAIENPQPTLDGAAHGAMRLVLGLAKKILVANVLFELVTAFGNSREPSVLFCWLYAAACSLQIYFDFSGYSDMAIGLGEILGFSFLENFHYPFLSGSATEFWRRWHISLGSWFRDYVYIPLGGNRGSTLLQVRNILIVWALTGLWHGAAWNFVLWGLFFAVFLLGEKFLYGNFLKKLPVLGHLYTLLLVAVSFVLFNASSLSSAAETIGSMFGAGKLPLATAESIYYLKSYAVVLLIAFLAATPLPAALVRRFSEKAAGKAVLAAAQPVVLTAMLVLCTAYLVDGSFNPFLYFRF